MARQFVGIRFRGRGIIYTYTNDGPEVFVGDRVKIDGRDGWSIQTVETVSLIPPNGNFQFKPIMGRVEDVAAPSMTPLEQVEADRCKASEIQNIRDGKCTTCGQAPESCHCLPF